MKLKTLVKGSKIVGKDVEVTGLSADSRTTAPGHLFIAKRGGAEFIVKAVEAGAVAVVTDLYDPFLKVPQVITNEEMEAKLASRFYGAPSKELFMVGVTGTKGKTTTSYMAQWILGGGLMSTVETVIGEERRLSTLTTHSAILTQKFLREMVGKGCKSAVLEVSSHGLDQGRVDEIEFQVGVFTNLFPDHLDYHGTVGEYAKAKKKLFGMAKKAVLNADNPWAEYMGQGMTFGIEKEADLRATGIEFSAAGTSFWVEGLRFEIGLMGRFNVYNALGAMGVGLLAGMSLEEIAKRLKTFEMVPGRLERVPNKKGAWVFVDYAHNGEALANVLIALREIARKRIICVFGCGGNRDPARRTEKARSSEKYADVSIVTSDNPRKEDPEAICEQIAGAFGKRPRIIVNRKEAIEHAIAMAEAEDIVLIAGKGHEKVQIFAHHTIPFDDVAIAKEAGI